MRSAEIAFLVLLAFDGGFAATFAQLEISNKVLDILRTLIIDDWQSEPYHEHQNPAERRYQTIKKYTNTILDRTGAPANTWLLALMYVCFVLNHAAHESLNWQTRFSILPVRLPISPPCSSSNSGSQSTMLLQTS
jgi:hypothetical protein